MKPKQLNMQKIKSFFSAFFAKYFPQHDAGTAAFITAIVLTAVMMTCIFANDYFVRGNDYTEEALFNVGAVLVFLGAAGATYVFGKTKDRIGK